MILMYLDLDLEKKPFAICLFPFPHGVSTRMIFFVNFTDHSVPLLLEPVASFSRSLCNVFLRTETRPVREKQIGRRQRD